MNRGALLGWKRLWTLIPGTVNPGGAEISQGTSTLLRSPAVDAQALVPQTLAVTEGETLIAEETEAQYAQQDGVKFSPT